MAPWFKGQNVKLQCGSKIMECKIKIDEGQFLALKDHQSIIGILSQNPIQIKKSATADRVIKLCFIDGAKPKTNPILGKSILFYTS